MWLFRSLRLCVVAAILMSLLGCGTSDAERHAATVATTEKMAEIFDQNSTTMPRDEFRDRVAEVSTEYAMMEDTVFGSGYYRTLMYNTFYGPLDASFDVHYDWISDDGRYSVALWTWSGTNFVGNPFEVHGLSVQTFDDDGRLVLEVDSYAHPDDYVREAMLGAGTG